MSEPFVIVGGGISGVLLAKIFGEKQIPFVGLEREERLGGRVTVGHHRLSLSHSKEVLSEFLHDVEWIEISEAAKQKRKGEWSDAEVLEDDSDNIFFRKPFFKPNIPFEQLFDRISQDVGDQFRLRAAVTKIDPNAKELELLSGEKIKFEKIFWCCDLRQLTRIWQGEKVGLQKILKKLNDPTKGINLDLELKKPLVTVQSTIVFPFRFKEKKMRAFGVGETPTTEGQTLHWLLPLENDFADDHEEVAKCLRTLKREIEKEFPEIKENLVAERIVYLSSASSEIPSEVKSPEILPGLFYLGPQILIEESSESLRDLDVVLQNLKFIRNSLLL
jgi:hypothetical protein